MSVENNFRGFTACRRYATYKEKIHILELQKGFLELQERLLELQKRLLELQKRLLELQKRLLELQKRLLGVSRKAHLLVIGRRNDEAIRILSTISGLLHSVRNDEIGLSRQPQ
jgi:predicted transcriptional regulator